MRRYLIRPNGLSTAADIVERSFGVNTKSTDQYAGGAAEAEVRMPNEASTVGRFSGRYSTDTKFMSKIYSNKAEDPDEDLVERVRTNQQKLASELKSYYDFIVCGSVSSGSVVARRLAESPAFDVLLSEAGGPDNSPSITEGLQWASNIRTERDWNFQTHPNPYLNGRTDSLADGQGLRGNKTAHCCTSIGNSYPSDRKYIFASYKRSGF